MDNTICIGKPYIERHGDYTRLCSDITRPSGKITFWFEVQSEYGQYLCDNNADAFILALYEYAMYKGYNIVSDAAISSDLYYQLESYGSSIMSENLSFFHMIRINAPVSIEKIENQGAVGTGFSAGVDSFYTVLKHLNSADSSKKLTHLLIANNGAFTGCKNEVSEKYFFEQYKRLKPVAEELGLPLISVNTNTGDFNDEVDVEPDATDHVLYNTAIKLASVVYALRKLFSTYYLAGAVPLNKFAFTPKHPDYAHLYYVKLLSTPSLMFYSSGSETTRLGKVEYIGKNKIVQNHLSLELGVNSAKSKKSVRTMFELYSLGILDEFKSVLDVEDFKKHLSSRLGRLFSEEGDNGFIEEAIAKCKLNGIKVPKAAYIKNALFYTPIKRIKGALKKNKTVRKIYGKYKANKNIKNGEE